MPSMGPPKKPGEKDKGIDMILAIGGGPKRPPSRFGSEESMPPKKSPMMGEGMGGSADMMCPNCGCPLKVTPQMEEEEPEEMGEEPEYKEAS